MSDKPAVFGWHFAANDKKLAYGDGRVITEGVTHWILDMDKNISLCEYGLHASLKPLDALEYASGSIVSYCRMHGKVIHGDVKMVAEGREYLHVFDAEAILREFARWCALQVIPLWEAPDVVKQYLTTGDVSLRAASAEASWAASWAASAEASWVASWAASWAASREASWAASRAASRAAQNAKLTEMLQAEMAKNKEVTE